jgi:hypothetical protein
VDFSLHWAGQLWRRDGVGKSERILKKTQGLETIAPDCFQFGGNHQASPPQSCPDQSRMTEICRP